ncbi:hypothetical protein RirG_024770 [Rhizophagus irregularis DAOM 197198w]|uniref:Uncharacterized protein n=1 Tax=Rhizophagus irregularis (strain DAOM 197198w) TaxID=1432141 RepID=A0A015K6D6_RHIIW|nr:hypothetical protein RirG_024770 [Rhizophagus irregularis DAOM 197198w]
MSEIDSKKRTRSKTKNDDVSLNKPQPKKSRGKAIKKEIKDETPPESDAPPSLENNNEVEGVSSQAQSKKWTPEQRLQLIEAVLKHVKVPWDEVSNEVDGGKNGKMCYDQWRRKIVPGLKTYINSDHEH